jgi:hypothetical protein
MRVGRDPLIPKLYTSKAIQTTTQNIGYYAYCGPNLSKVSCSLHLRVPDLGDTPPTIYHLGVSIGGLGG